MPHLVPVAQDVQRVLVPDHLLHQVGDDVAHRQLHVATDDLDLAPGPHLADAHAIERPHDRVRQLVLVARGACEVLDRELLEAVRRVRRWHDLLLALVRRPPSADSNTIEELM